MNKVENIEQLLNEVQTIYQSYSKVAESTGENFNIFSVLQIEHYEVTTHSRFIAELLNPNGCHGQKAKFLNKFLEILKIKLNSDNAQVFTEYYIGEINEVYTSGGRVDILVKFLNNQVIVIENKIYAIDQKNQLLRYRNMFPDGIIIYLSLSKDNKTDKEQSDDHFIKIYYETDIIEWLEDCRMISVSNPILRETLSQYINLIKKLTNQNFFKQMNQEIVSRVLKDENSFESFKILVNTKSDVLKTVLNWLLSEYEKISQKFNLAIHVDREVFINNTGEWENCVSFDNDKLREMNIKISFDFNIKSGYKDLIFGFKYFDRTKSSKIDYSILKEKFKKSFGNLETTGAFPCFCQYNGYNDWENLETLKKVRYGNYCSDMETKLSTLLDIIKDL